MYIDLKWILRGFTEFLGHYLPKKMPFWLIWDIALISKIRLWSIWTEIQEKTEHFNNFTIRIPKSLENVFLANVRHCPNFVD